MAVKVLIVDDQASFRAAAADVVRASAGFELIGEAANGEDAVESASRLRPDLVLMDVNLPGINGLEATRRILANRTDVVVFLLSTYDREDLGTRLNGSGASTFIPKAGFDSATLVEAWQKGVE